MSRLDAARSQETPKGYSEVPLLSSALVTYDVPGGWHCPDNEDGFTFRCELGGAGMPA